MKGAGFICKDALIIDRFDVLARIPCTIGKENLPSVKSSQNPLLLEY